MEFREFLERYSIQLNAEQQEAVRQVEGPVLLLAVPGSGKTTVLVTRLGYMIHCCGIAPEHILTLTYTVAATNDMRERFRSIFGHVSEEAYWEDGTPLMPAGSEGDIYSRLEFRTINGICAKVIAYYSRLIGKPSFSLETNEKQITGLLSTIYQKLTDSYATESELKDIRTQITYIKNMRLTSEEICKLKKAESAGTSCDLEAIYREYTARLRAEGKMDYDDQMIYAYNILRRSPETLAYFRAKYPYICVDEAQDTSKIQHEIIAILAGERDNLFMVGDEDQSIYGFRAAWPEALLGFEQNHPGAKVLLMEANYRSTGAIVAACDGFVQKNTLRHEKHMRATRPQGTPIRRIELMGRGAQYTYLKKVAENLPSQGTTAVLYREHEDALPLIDLLDRAGLPYRIRNAEIGFFSHRIVQDICSILRFAEDPQDKEAFLAVYYKLSTYMNKQTAQEVCRLAGKHHVGILDAAIEMGSLPPKVLKNCRDLRRQFSMLRRDEAQAALSRILGPMGYGEYLDRQEMKDSKTPILRQLARQVKKASELPERLTELETLIRSKEQDPSCPLILSTIHASKGLEYDTVYLLDMIDGVFPDKVPKSRSQAEPGEWETYEEERRIFYVGATRAKNQLNVFLIQGKTSTFLEDLLGKDDSMEAGTSRATSDRSSSESPVRANAQPVRPAAGRSKPGPVSAMSKPAPKKRKEFREDEFRRFCADLGEGMPVRHRNLGDGVIAGMTDTVLVIAFEDQERRFSLELLYMKDLLEYEK